MSKHKEHVDEVLHTLQFVMQLVDEMQLPFEFKIKLFWHFIQVNKLQIKQELYMSLQGIHIVLFKI